MPYQHLSACTIGYYLFELAANRYGRLAWSIVVHHLLTIAACVQILFGVYSPFGSWYAFTLISMVFPADLCLAARATVSNRYPEHTRAAFTVAFYWVLCCLALNTCGQLFLITNALLPSNFDDAIRVYQVVLMIFAIACWIYDDYKLLTALRDFAAQDYAAAWVLDKHEPELPTLTDAGSAVQTRIDSLTVTSQDDL